MKSSYIPMMLLVGVVALFAFLNKDKNLDNKWVDLNSNELRVAPVALTESHVAEEAESTTASSEEVVFKCKKVITPKAYDIDPTEKK